jgi:drug/metabolite transporter (DMT)-like permease
MPTETIPEGHTKAHNARLWADLSLLLTAMIWGSAFVAQRIAAGQVGVFIFNGLRFMLAALALLPLALWKIRAGRYTIAPTRQAYGGIALAGILLAAAAAFQQAGLRFTTAGNAGFITGLYVVLIPIFLALFFKRRARLVIWLAGFLAAAGLFLLSTGGRFELNPGDALELIGAVLWALHVIVIGWLAKQYDLFQIAIGQYLVCGMLSLSIGLLFEWHSLPGLAASWIPLLYTGLLSVAVGYTLQVSAQRVAPPADAAILLSSEAAFAALAGWLILDERLSALQLIGCGLMFASMLLAQAGQLRKRDQYSRADP